MEGLLLVYLVKVYCISAFLLITLMLISPLVLFLLGEKPSKEFKDPKE